MMADGHVDVLVQIAGEDVPAGRLWSHRRRGSESMTFAYDSSYLALRDAYELDPALPLLTGQQQTAVGREIFGAFSDCAPDGWGRRLIQRAEQRRLGAHGGAARTFGEIDYLLGVRDDLRQGALRFRDPTTGAHLAVERTGVPQLLDLSTLLGAVDHVERDEAGEADLQTLLHGGSSLGGARPKAHVLDDAGRVAIAKFPRSDRDDWDVTRWEAVALALARRAGIDVPPWTLHTIDGRGVLIIERFDRRRGHRIGYVSAMTMLEATDRQQASYLELAEVIERSSADAVADLRELWRRIAFSILISNTDDHLRNHGFLRTSSAGWSLSPAFDLNPNPEPGPKHLTTAIDLDTFAARIDVLMGVAEYFALRDRRAREILSDVATAIGGWRSAARRLELSNAAIDHMAGAFEHEQIDVARAIGGGGRRATR
jgi:serine/threonine-protein kinase HipA